MTAAGLEAATCYPLGHPCFLAIAVPPGGRSCLCQSAADMQMHKQYSKLKNGLHLQGQDGGGVGEAQVEQAELVRCQRRRIARQEVHLYW